MKINKIHSLKNIKSNINYIGIPIENFNKVKKFAKINEPKEPIIEFIKKKISENPDRRNLSCRKLAKCYQDETGISVSKSKVNNIIKNQMGFHYLKTTIKTSQILEKENILITFAFIKIITRSIKLRYKINYRCYRKRDEQIYFRFLKKEKRNLLLAVDEERAIYWEITKENTTETIFLNFISKLKEKLTSILYPKFILLMDNHSSHKTPLLLKYYEENRINILFNVPYVSTFNGIELAFRYIKRILYMTLFSSIDEACSKVESLLKEEKISETLFLNYAETIEQYIKFIEKNNFINLNNY